MVAATPAEELDWVRLREDMDQTPTETMLEKAKRKFGESPLIPVGCLATVAALSTGIYNFWKGDSQMSQYMMRARVAAQAFTVLAVLASLTASQAKERLANNKEEK